MSGTFVSLDGTFAICAPLLGEPRILGVPFYNKEIERRNWGRLVQSARDGRTIGNPPSVISLTNPRLSLRSGC